MNCYMCDKKLNNVKYTNKYVCICNKCLQMLEKAEERMVKYRVAVAEMERGDNK